MRKHYSICYCTVMMKAYPYLLLPTANKLTAVHHTVLLATVSHSVSFLNEVKRKKKANHWQTQGLTTWISRALMQSWEWRRPSKERGDRRSSSDTKTNLSDEDNILAVYIITGLNTPKLPWFWYCTQAYNIDAQRPIDASAQVSANTILKPRPRPGRWYDAQYDGKHSVDSSME